MQKFNLVPIILLLLLSGCEKEDTIIENPSFDDFQRELKVGMECTALINKFGEPDRDIGSGLHIYVYELNDSTEARIGCADKIMYITHNQ